MTNTQQYHKLKREIKGLKEQIKSVGELAIKELATEFFKAFPEVECFSWTQYTPYWNDGDVCEFGAHTDYPEIIYYKDPYDMDKERVVEREIGSFMDIFEADHLEWIFGDHIEVTVYREGIKISEYDHD